MKPKIIKTQAKEIFTKTKLPGCDWVINQYVGCGHNCSYCYARFMGRWKGYGEWGSWVEAKVNAPALVKNRYVPGKVFISSVSDAYQPVEKELKLTRKVLENMDKNIALSILTKSDLVLRDIDVLKQFKKVEVGFTINSFTDNEKALFEPDSPTNEERIEAMKILKKNGIKTYAFISPIIPGLISPLSSRPRLYPQSCHSDRTSQLKDERRNPLVKKVKPNYNDSERKGFLHSSLREISRNDSEGLLDIINQTKDFADYYWFEVLNLRGAGKEFSDMLEKEYPESYKIMKDKKLFEQYINELKNTISSSDVKVKGIEIH